MDRASGWEFAKRDGHENERVAGAALRENYQAAKDIVSWVSGQELGQPFRVDVDGSSKISTVHGDKVIGKTDLTIHDDKITPVGISVKKSNAGQVWLVSVDRFLEALKDLAPTSDSADLVSGLRLFVGGPENLKHVREMFASGVRMSAERGFAWHSLEERHQRLAMGTIRVYSRTLYEEIIDFFQANVSTISRLCFASGSASRPEDQAKGILYNNAPGGPQIFSIEKLERELTTGAHKISPGPRNGGTTIWLPFGFLQMHRPQGKNLLQFHHQLERLKANAPNSYKTI